MWTTEQWEALLDGTTPGPWIADIEECDYYGGTGEIGAIYSDDGEHFVLGKDLSLESDEECENLRLAAHAPEAVAEAIRLRKAITELEAEERATADDEFFPVHLRDLCRAYADDLARILEGDTDE